MVSRCWPNACKATIREFSRSRMYLEGGEGWSRAVRPSQTRPPSDTQEGCYGTALSGFWFDAAHPPAPLAQTVTELLGPEAIGLFHVVPRVGHAAQALRTAAAIDRL